MKYILFLSSSLRDKDKNKGSETLNVVSLEEKKKEKVSLLGREKKKPALFFMSLT